MNLSTRPTEPCEQELPPSSQVFRGKTDSLFSKEVRQPFMSAEWQTAELVEFLPKFFVHKFLKFSGEGLVQQRLLQRVQRGLLPLVEASEALGIFQQHIESSGNLLLHSKRWDMHGNV